VIPETKCSEAHLFAISGNDPIFIYDLLKLPISLAFAIEFHGTAAILTNTAMKMMILKWELELFKEV